MRFMQKLFSIVLALALTVALVSSADTALAETDDAISQSQLLTMLVSAYEFITDSEVDESAITSKLSTDKNLRKALELDLIDDYEVGWVSLYATRQNVAMRVLAFKNALRQRYYGGAAAQATVGQARDEIGLVLKLMGCASGIGYAREITGELSDDELLTREKYCELLVRTYETLYGTVDTGNTEMPTDSDNDYVLKCISLGLISGYEKTNTFEPDKAVQLRQLASPLLKLINYDSHALDEVSKNDARVMVSEVLLSCIGVEPADDENKSVLLDVEWDWYVNQLTSGKYSANNCMPACGEMVLNYLNRDNNVTAQTLRSLSPHEGQGWYDVELYDVLTDQGVKLDSVYDMTVSNMISDLDDGHLLIVMCNFDGAQSGHAMVVCGYETSAAGTWFICNDPESPTTNKYGKPSGYQRRVESQELIDAMNRHVERYFRVMS